MVIGTLTIFMFLFYLFVLFKNGIDLNEITIEFTILFTCCCVVMLLLTKIMENKTTKQLAAWAIVVVVLMTGVISYVAITEIPENKKNVQLELATILGNSAHYNALGINGHNDIESITFHGEPKAGNFDQILGYVVEVKVTNREQVYYFMCAGTGPSCMEFKQVENPFP